MSARKSITPGSVFGRLTAVCDGDRKQCSDGQSYATTKCLCECGNEVVVKNASLQSGHTQSCGCLQRERTSLAAKTHGHAKRRCAGGQSPEYQIWCGMIKRTENQASIDFADYGGRGIMVCRRWRSSFSNFLEDMGPRPSPQHSIDRFPDVNGHYEPGNCRWATPTEQARNKRNNRILTINGVSKCVAEWAAISGRMAATITKRHNRGMCDYESVFGPLKVRNQELK